MSRTRASAKAAGSAFERSIADYLQEALGQDAIDRQVKTGAKDKGDIANVRFRGHRLAIECKDAARIDLPGWTREAKQEAINLAALAGFVIAKRKGTTKPGEQWLIGTVDELVALITELPVEETK